MSKDPYPTDAELDMIQQWPIKCHGDAIDLLMHVKTLWQYADAGYFTQYDIGEKWEISLPTAGWSGNESIIEALQSNCIFWGLYWYSSHRGGHYVFRVPKEAGE